MGQERLDWGLGGTDCSWSGRAGESAFPDRHWNGIGRANGMEHGARLQPKSVLLQWFSWIFCNIRMSAAATTDRHELLRKTAPQCF
jgi:hypothetical protein